VERQEKHEEELRLRHRSEELLDGKLGESLINQGIQGLMMGLNRRMERKRAERKSGKMPEDRSAQ
jgi:uncharacterized membrane protein YidH (DUF202 family)